MQGTITNEELRAEYVRLMGSDLGCLVYELQGELEWLRYKWNQYQELFEKGPERIALLITVASTFFVFNFLHKLLFEDAMLHLSRLTDTSQMGKWKNLTFRSLSESISDPALKAQVQIDAEKVQGSSQFAREWRNKRLAHTDLETYRNEEDSSFVISKNVEDALESMRVLLGSVKQYYGLPLSAFVADSRGARSLVHYLEEAVRAKDNENKYLRDVAEGKSSR